MSTQLDQVVARCETILAQCIVAANQAAQAAASIGTAGLAPLQSPAFTGEPTAPTPTPGDASTRLATTAWISAKLGQASGIATLDTDGFVPLSQLPFAGLTSKGTWNAATNTPTLAAGTAGNDNGDFYIVTVSGSTNLDGITTWAVGDWALFSGAVWTKVPYVAPPVSNLPLSSLESIAAGTVVANTTGGSASPASVTIASLMGYLGVTTTGGSGLCPTLAGGTATFLRADGVFASPGAPDLSAYALLNSPAFTGTATVTTQVRDLSSTAIATTEFVIKQYGSSAEVAQLQMNGAASAGSSTYGARLDHIHPSDTSRAAAVNPTLSGSAGSYTGKFTVTGTAVVSGTLTVTGSATISGSLSTGALSPASVSGAVIAEGNLSLTDITTNNASASKHGLLPKLSNVATQYLNGQGGFTTPPDTVGLTGATSGLTTSGANAIMDTNNTNGVGSYAIIKPPANTINGATFTSGVFMRVGTAGGIEGGSISGTWRNVSGDTLNGGADGSGGLCIRVS